MIAMIDYNLYLMKVTLVVNENPFIECKGKLNKQNKISQVFHCDGLLLCVLDDDDTKAIVWNPYWCQTRCLEFRYSHRPYRRDMFSYALGYEDKGSCRSYKFLRFIDQCVDYIRPETNFYGMRFTISTLVYGRLLISLNTGVYCVISLACLSKEILTVGVGLAHAH